MSLTTPRTILGMSIMRAGGDLAGDHDEAGLGQRLAGDARPYGPLSMIASSIAVRDLVAQLVGVAFGDAFGREQVLGHRMLLKAGSAGKNAEVSQRRALESMTVALFGGLLGPLALGRAEC